MTTLLASGSNRTEAADQTAAPSWAGRWPLWAAILGLALVARLVFVAVVPNEILWLDGKQFDAVARLLVERGTYGLQTIKPPGYPTVMAGVYLLFGPNLVALRIVEAMIGTLAVALIGVLGTRLFGRVPGLIAAGLTALHPVLAFLPSTEYSENVAFFVITLALLFAFDAWRRGGSWRWGVAGLLIGAATLIRPNLVTFFAGVAVGFLVILVRERRAWVAPLGVCTAAAVLAIVPWVVRNHRVHDHWFFISTGGGRQFWYGNNPWTDCSTLVHTPMSAEMNEDMARMPDEFAQEAYLYRKGQEFVREQPGRAAWLYVVKLGNLFALYPETKSRTFINNWSRWAQSLASLVIYSGVVIGLVRRRGEPTLWPLMGGVVCFALVNSMFFSCMRYRMAFEPCLLLVAGLGWAEAWKRLPSRART